MLSSKIKLSRKLSYGDFKAKAEAKAKVKTTAKSLKLQFQLKGKLKLSSRLGKLLAEL